MQTKVHIVPLMTSVPLIRCDLPEWPVLSPRVSTEFYANAAIPTLRAHAAGKPKSHNGLFAAVRCDCTRNQREIGRRVAAMRTKLPFASSTSMAAFLLRADEIT
jgi:hypothetical protein